MRLGENRDTILDVMDLVHQPMFLLEVVGPETFIFRGLNPVHQSMSGLTNEMVCDKTPHDAFPQRVADTIVQNYETCRASGKDYTYEELLELPTGPLWWQTTLSPVFNDKHELCQIIGLAVDITERKEATFGASQKLSDMTRLNEDLQVFASATAQDMRGPFQTMVALIDMVMDGFVDLGDEKADQLALCSEIAEDAITSMSGILATAQGLKVATEAVEEVDMGHVTSDIAALLDPHQRLNIELPRAKVTTDRVAMQMVLRNLMENAMRYADKNVCISVSDSTGNAPDSHIAITVSDDGVGMSADTRSDGQTILPTPGQVGADFGVNSAQAIVGARGGSFTRAQNNFTTGAAIRFTLPGSLAGQQREAQPKEGKTHKPTPFQMTGYTQVGTGLPSKIRPT
jgi:PAS domain S-box-containing protein